MILSIIYLITVGILGLDLLVFVHEFGHLVTAIARGMKVESFSIGMGPKIFGFARKGIEYKFSWILIGGYVKFAGDELDEKKDVRNIPGGFFSASPWSRILVSSAGGIFNIILACLLYTVVFYGGKSVPSDSLNTVIGEIVPNSAAVQAGLMPGDKIVKINHNTVNKWEEVVRNIAFSNTEKIQLKIERNGKILCKNAVIRSNPKIGIKQLGVYPKETIVIEKILKNSPAQKAGMTKGDEIISVNGQRIFRIKLLVETIRKSEGRRINFSILRAGKRLNIHLSPVRLNAKGPAIAGFIPGVPMIVIHPLPLKQFWHDLSLMGYTLKGLVTRKVRLKAMAGPIGIVTVIANSTHYGWDAFFGLIALISLNLGIINLLPIPILDGGHILFVLIEFIIGRPISIKAMVRIQNVFLVLLVILFLYISYNDILRFFA